MKNIHTNFMTEYILKLTGEYASANRIHDVLNLSLSFTYTLANWYFQWMELRWTV